MKKRFDVITDVEKFNPYHDHLGRFTTANGASSFTFRTKDPKKQHMADMAVARAKEKVGQYEGHKHLPTDAQKKTLERIASETRGLRHEELRVVDKRGELQMMLKGNENSVQFYVSDAEECMPGNIVVHNHPGYELANGAGVSYGGSFSNEDLRIFKFGATEIRAIAPEGDYILRDLDLKHKHGYGSGWFYLEQNLQKAEEKFASQMTMIRRAEAKLKGDTVQRRKMSLQEDWIKAKARGASQSELDEITRKTMSADTDWMIENQHQVEYEARKMFIDQFHDFYTKHAAEHRMEYEFIPNPDYNPKVKKGVESEMQKSDQYDTIVEIEKYNHHHDERGRFTFAPGNGPGGSGGSSNAKGNSEQDEGHRRSTTAAQEKELSKIADKTRNLKREVLRVVDKDGNVVLLKRGGESSVSYSTDEGHIYLRGNVVIHNHPPGGTFSKSDLKCLAYGPIEMRVASPEGDYIMRNLDPENKKGGPDWAGLRKKVEYAEARFDGTLFFGKIAREKYADSYKRVQALEDRFFELEEQGASDDELDGAYTEYLTAKNAWNAEYQPKIKKEATALFYKQYHDFYAEQAAQHNIEYEFIPKVEKSAFFDLEDDVAKADSHGDIVLDADFNRMINEITEKVINDITGGGKLLMAKRYDTLVEVEKFNPYHDHLGRFTTAPGGGGGSSYGVGIAPKPLTMADFNKPRTYETFDQKKERLRGKTPSETIRNVEKDHVKKDYEILTVVDKQGGIIFFAEGSATHVSLTYREKAQLKNAYATHNHPSETHFSTADIRTTVETNGLGIRATTPSGKVYSLERKSMPDNRHEFSVEYDKQIQPVIDAAKSKMDSMGHSDKVKAGTMTQKEANVLFQSYINDGFSAWLTENASKYGFEYTEERVDVQKAARYDVIIEGV